MHDFTFCHEAYPDTISPTMNLFKDVQTMFKQVDLLCIVMFIDSYTYSFWAF